MTDPVDLENLREMIGNDKAIEKELISVFLTSSDECLESLKENTSDENNETWKSQSHAWKGLALNLGANQLGELCSEAQNNKDLNEISKKELLTKIIDEYEKVKIFLKTA